MIKHEDDLIEKAINKKRCRCTALSTILGQSIEG